MIDLSTGYARLAIAEKNPDEASCKLAGDHLAKAKALIKETGYHRRDNELAELEKAVEEL